MRAALFLCSLTSLLGVAVLESTTENHPTADVAVSAPWVDFWLVRLLFNLIGYGSVFIPGYFLVKYFKKIDYNLKAGSGFFPNVVRLCVFGGDPLIGEESGAGLEGSKAGTGSERTFLQKAVLLTFCAAGLLVSYLSWGLLQERIMQYDYSSQSGEVAKFTNSQFLVFINRALALLVALAYLALRPQARHRAPLYKYSYCSFSNIMSSWFQYEALKIVSFPTQVLVKASKVIPVMLMGKVVSNKTYKAYEYASALLLSLGVFLFLSSRGSAGDKAGVMERVTTVSGVVIMMGYMAFDAFTSNWQSELFSKYSVSSVQMMAGVNLFSCLFTGISLLEQGTFFQNFTFMQSYPLFNLHAISLSIVSATGQLFIYYTISVFGPVTFVIIMTVRMGLSILLSCMVYHHAISAVGVLGIVVVFTALFFKIYWGQKLKRSQGSPKLQGVPAGPSIVISKPQADQQS